MRTTIAFFFFSFDATVVIFGSLPQACTNRTGGGRALTNGTSDSVRKKKSSDMDTHSFFGRNNEQSTLQGRFKRCERNNEVIQEGG